MAKIIELFKNRINSGNILVFILLSLCIFFGNKFRILNYSTVPFPGETADEYSFGWLGISLIKDKYPVAWSGLPIYKDHDYQKINVDQIYDRNPGLEPFSIDKPWFDHPPLMGLLVGGYAYLKGARDFVDASVIILRRPMLKIAILNTLLIFILASRLFDRWVGLLGSFFYSIIPTEIISSRLAVAENGYIPLFLLTLIFANEFFKRKNIKYWNWAVIFASLAILFKLSAVSIAITLFVLAFSFGKKQKKKLMLTVLVGLAASLALFAVYGAFFDWNVFISVVKQNSNRFFGASSEVFYSLLTKPAVVKFFTDGWVLALWISFFAVVSKTFNKSKNVKFLSIAIFSYLFTFLFFGSESYGWYRFPFYPLLIIIFSYFTKDLWMKGESFLFFLVSLLPLGTSIHRLYGVEGFQTLVPCFRIFVVIWFVVFAASFVFKRETSKTVNRLLILLIMGLLVYFSIREIYFLDFGKWIFIT